MFYSYSYRDASSARSCQGAERHPGDVEIETVEITVPDQISALHSRLATRTFDMLFVSAGVTHNPQETIGEVTTDEFIRIMVTNALSPMRVVETLCDLVSVDGTIGVMSSGQGGVSNNTMGQREVYRGSKAALNMYMRSFAARHSADRRTMVLMAPGWVRTQSREHFIGSGRQGWVAVPGLPGEDGAVVAAVMGRGSCVLG